MPKAHPKALRSRAVKAYLNNPVASMKHASERFMVGEASVKRWVWKFLATGEVPEKARIRGPLRAGCGGP
ncbi:MAG: transposase [Myxococcota bacterium]|jgi:transposase